MERGTTFFQIFDAERRFRRACEQIGILDDKISRFEKIKRRRQGLNSSEPMERSIFITVIRLQTALAVRNLYHEYAMKTASEIAEMRQSLQHPDERLLLNIQFEEPDSDTMYDRV